MNIGEKISKFLENIKKKNIDDKEFKRILTGFMIFALIGISAGGYGIKHIRTRAFNVYLGQEEIGIVKNKDEVEPLMEELQKELSDTYQMEVVLKKDLEVEKTNAKDDLLLSKEEIKEIIKSKISFEVEAYALNLDGKEVGALSRKEDLENLIEEIKAPYKEAEKGKTIEEIKILEDVEIVKKEMPLKNISQKEDLKNYLLTGAEKTDVHTVEVGESLWTIAKIHGMDVEDLEKANPDKDPARIQIGDEIKLIREKSMLTVASLTQVEYSEEVEFEKKVEEDPSMFTNEKKVKQKGEKGLSKILAKEEKHNGQVIKKEIVKEEIVEKPREEIIILGTKEVPKTAATGAFLMPTRGRISSRYGMRNGRMHKGLDIAAGSGTAIKAADGGKVVYAGPRGAYGNLVEIDHGNGYKTRYAHCSKILVSPGSKVYKGQEIAHVGNTGRSTGPHLHLEVLKNGTNQNPSNYVQ